MSQRFTKEETMKRMATLIDSSGDVLEAYMELEVARLHESLEQVRDYGELRFIQGQIAGIRDFCTVVE